MPILKKLIKIGNSRAVILPAQWLDYYEQEGNKVELIYMEADDAIIIRIPKSPESQSP